MGDFTVSQNGGEIVSGEPQLEFRRLAHELREALALLRQVTSDLPREQLVDHASLLLDHLLEVVERPTSAVGVVRVQASEVRVGDRLIADMTVSHEFLERPRVVSVGPLGPMVQIRFDPPGSSGGLWSLGPTDPMLVDRPPADPAPPSPDPVLEETVRAGTPRLTEESAEAGMARVARILDEHERPGSPVADPERGRLWLPTSPRRLRTGGAR
jgi:hypothetical protein